VTTLLLLAALCGQTPPALAAGPTVYSLTDSYGRVNQSTDPVYLTAYVRWVNGYRAAENQRITDLFLGLLDRPIAAGHEIPGRDYRNTRNTIFGRGHRVPIR
jgi:hypothetical protein